MRVVELYSKRQKRLRGELPDVFTYNEIPQGFRVQAIHIIRDGFGAEFSQRPGLPGLSFNQEKIVNNHVFRAYDLIHDQLCREFKLFRLTDPFNIKCDSPGESVLTFLLECKNTEKVLDLIELSFQVMNSVGNNWQYRQNVQPEISPDDAIAELNLRFRENGLGYQFENNQIIRIDSTYLHAEVVKPTLKLLSNPAYKGAEEEFLKAHEHYRHQRYQECLNECLKALESTLKIICDRQNWSYNKTDTAKKLVNVCFDNELIPKYMQTQFSSFRSLLESGVPTIRNKNSGHGQGNNNIQVNQELASYALHLTASNILFLVKSEQKL